MEMSSADVFEYERYELVLRHFITEKSGDNVPLEQPIVCAYSTPIGYPVCKTEILKRLQMEMQKFIDNT